MPSNAPNSYDNDNTPNNYIAFPLAKERIESINSCIGDSVFGIVVEYKTLVKTVMKLYFPLSHNIFEISTKYFSGWCPEIPRNVMWVM